MAGASKTRTVIEGLMREGSFKWLLGSRTSFDEEFEEMGKAGSNGWIPELSPVANAVVRRCSKILGISLSDLQESFNTEASDQLKHPSCYARNFLEYCCFRTLALSTQVTSHLADKKFRRLTYDMMLAWEAPAVASQPTLKIDGDADVGIEAFSRIAPAVPIIANVIICDYLFEVLSAATGGRLQYTVYQKYLGALERAIRRLKSQSESSLLSTCRASRAEKILEVDGTVTMQPVLEHVGMSTWPGRLILTDHALYFEALRVVSYDKAKQYDLADDLKQVVKPELSGPWGTRLFDKAVSYKSISLPEPVMIEFPELKGHCRRDYWLAIIREILYAHQFIHKFQITEVEQEEALSKAVLGILRLQAIHEICSATPIRNEAVLMFNLCDQLPGGDLILETLANMSTSRQLDRTNSSNSGDGMYSISALASVSNLFGTTSGNHIEAGIIVGETAVGKMTTLERVVRDSKTDYKKTVLAQTTIDGVKVDGIDTNLAVMKELVFPAMEFGRWLFSLACWENPAKSSVFCAIFTYIILKEWLGFACALVLILVVVFMVLTRYSNSGEPVEKVKVLVPPTMTRMEQLLAVQNAISQAEGFIQDGNIILLKLRALFCSIFPQASEKFVIVLLILASVFTLLPSKYVLLMIFLEISTCYSPPRRASTERWIRRMKDWWLSVPAAPVIIESDESSNEVKG